jgi:hypothetical protein
LSGRVSHTSTFNPRNFAWLLSLLFFIHPLPPVIFSVF